MTSTRIEIDTLVTIGIASKARPQVLDRTLRKLHEYGLGCCQLIVFDDASMPAINPPALTRFKNAVVIRVEESVGQAMGRNRICEMTKTPYLLQLDDDSYPVGGNLEALLELASNERGWLAIAIPFEEPSRRLFTNGVPSHQLIQVRSFVGCSALLNVECFRRVGGYAPWIGGYVEEDELALRGWKAGLSTVSINLLRIRHDVTDVTRSLSGIAYRSFRNWLLMWALHAPLSVLPIRVARLVGSSIWYSVQHWDLAPLKGILAGLRILPNVIDERAPLTLSDYWRWRRLPHALDYLKRLPTEVLPSRKQ